METALKELPLVELPESHALLETIKSRRSIRKFRKDVQPNAEEISLILEAAAFAPSGLNQQPWKFTVIRNREFLHSMSKIIDERLEQLAKLIKDDEFERFFNYYRNFFTFFKGAPVVIAVSYKPYLSYVAALYNKSGLTNAGDPEEDTNPALQSAAAAVQNILLSAHALGLGGCWMTAPLIAKVKLEEILDIKEPWRLFAIVPIGIPDEAPTAPSRKKTQRRIVFID